MLRPCSLEGTVMFEAISAGVVERDAKKILKMLVDRGLGEGDIMRNWSDPICAHWVWKGLPWMPAGDSDSSVGP